MKTKRVLAMLVMALLVTTGLALADDGEKRVRCDKGQTLTKALQKAGPGDTLLVSGICRERVTITTDRITIDGQGSAVLDGGGGSLADFTGVLTIDGAKGVRLQGLTIRHGPGEGIPALRGAAFTAEHTVSRDNGGTGIAVAQGSTAELSNCTMSGNLAGLDVFTGASAVLRDAVAIDQNSANGMVINGQAVVEIRAANVTASGNGGSGIVVGSGQLAIFGFLVTASALTTNDNGFAGIQLGGSLFTVYSAATVTASGNGVFGILSGGPSFLVTTPGSGSRFLIGNNAVGMRLQAGAGMNFNFGGQLTVTGNGVGLQADASGTLTVVSDPAQPSAITGNGTDVDLVFGSRATFDSVQIGTLVTDGTSLCRGAAKPGCP